MDFVKGDLCLFNELLFALNGFYDRSYQTNSSLNISAFASRFSNLHGLPQVGELLNLSCLYSQLSDYLSDYSTRMCCVFLVLFFKFFSNFFLFIFSLEPDQFKFLIFDLIRKALNKTYLRDLISFDFYNKLTNESVIKLNSLLKVS